MNVLIYWILAFFLVLLPFQTVLFDSNRVFTYRDFLQTFLPNKHFWVSSVLETGALPLWNAFAEGGIPFWADFKSGVLYPLNLIFIPFGTEFFALGMSWFVFAHIVLAYIGAYLYLRSHDLSRELALICAIPFALCGAFLSSISMRTILLGWMVMPFFFYFLRSWEARRASILSWQSYGLVLSAVLLILGSAIEFAYFLLLYLGVYALWLRTKPAMALTIIVGVFTALISAMQLLPGIALFLESARGASGVQESMASIASFHPVRIIEFFIALPFGNYIPELNYWGTSFVNTPLKTPLIFSCYLGVFTMLGLLALSKRNLLQYRFKFGLLFALLLVSFGAFLPINFYAIFHSLIPGWKLLRYPEKFVLFASFLILTLSAMGWKEVISNLSDKKFLKIWAIKIGVSTTIIGCAYIGISLGNQKIFPSAELALFFGFSIVILLCALLAQRFLQFQKYFLLFVLILVGADLGLHANNIRWDQPTAIMNPPLAGEIRKDLLARSSEIQEGASFRYNAFFSLRESFVQFSGAKGLIDPVGRQGMSYLSRLLPNTSSLFGIHDTDVRGAIRQQRKTSRLAELFQKDQEKALDLVGAYYIVEFPEAGAESFKIRLNSDSVPYIFFPKYVHFLTKVEQGDSILASEKFLVQESSIIEVPSQVGIFRNHSNRTVQILEKSNGYRKLRISGPTVEEGGQNYILLGESFDAHWHAEINAEESPVLRANLWSMAVDLADKCNNSCTLTMSYRNPFIPIGVVVSILAWILLTALCFTQARLPMEKVLKSH